VARIEASAKLQKHNLLFQFDEFKIPIELAKVEGPVICLTFVGIMVNAVSTPELSSWG